MAKSPHQKLKLLYLKKMLLEKTDENHSMTVVEMIAEFAALGISAERKSIYDDLEALRFYEIDIVKVQSVGTSYYVASREFELPEIKLLVDSVQSSKFITLKKTMTLIKKIEKLASVHDAKQLHRQVYVKNRVKAMNESVYYNIDEISAGISENKKIRFKYFRYNVKKEREFRKNGEAYEVSPFAMFWDDENYYLIAYDTSAQMIKHYRIDKMTGISITQEIREGKEAFEQIDLSSYSKKVFSMYAGEECNVLLRFDNKLAGVVIDQFGKDIIIGPTEQDHFIICIPIEISPQFFAWVFGLGKGVRILGPDTVVTAFTEHLKTVLREYSD